MTGNIKWDTTSRKIQYAYPTLEKNLFEILAILWDFYYVLYCGLIQSRISKGTDKYEIDNEN